ncbi:PEP-CTERM sorting domain-containing protein [Aliiglaciecola lipolytica]|nr:PEP-CTERM sorting domain-containing protein [Aliiglaciecola lipolytica]
MAYDFSSDTVYMVGGRNNNNLYTVNQTSGAATLIGSHGISDLFAIAFDTTTNTLFGTQFSNGSGLFSLNTSNGSATTINAAMGIGIGGLTYNHVTDDLVGMNDGAGDIYSIDRTNGSQSLIHNGAFVNDSGFTFDADKNLYWDIDFSGNLYSYDIANNFARTTHLTGLGSFDGAVYLNEVTQEQPNDIPEPTTLAILALGLMGLASRKFRK